MSERPIPPLLADEVERLARDLCDSYYLTVDPERPLVNAFDKVTEKTRGHWRAQALQMMDWGWRR